MLIWFSVKWRSVGSVLVHHKQGHGQALADTAYKCYGIESLSATQTATILLAKPNLGRWSNGVCLSADFGRVDPLEDYCEIDNRNRECLTGIGSTSPQTSDRLFVGV